MILRPLIRPRPARPGELAPLLRKALGEARARRTRVALATNPDTRTTVQREADRHGR